MSYTTSNYMAHGGNELVIGGKLTFLPGATIEGTDTLSEALSDSSPKLPYIANSTASTVANLCSDFNALLTALRSSGFMAEEEDDGDDDG